MDQPVPTFRPVPLQVVLQAAVKNDLKAIYRRIRRTVGAFDEEIVVTGDDGMPLWDLTTPLPVARHNDWMKKGFEYVTLADRDSLDKVAPFLAIQDPPLNVRDYVCHPHFGAWNPKLYAAVAAEGDRAAIGELFRLLDQYGVQTVEAIRGTRLPPAVLAAWKARQPKTTSTTALPSVASTTDGLGNTATPPAKAASKPRARKPAAAKGEAVGAKS